MELLKKSKEWFLSEEGGKVFAALSSVSDRAFFIYAYLKTISNEIYEKNNVLFKTSFLLADAIFNSEVEYSKFPQLLDEKKNPFIAFFVNAEKDYTEKQLYCIFLSFIHNIANPLNKNEWIYNKSLFEDYGYARKLNELGHMFVIPNRTMMIDAKAYNCDEKFNMIQLEIIWIFGEKLGG